MRWDLKEAEGKIPGSRRERLLWMDEVAKQIEIQHCTESAGVDARSHMGGKEQVLPGEVSVAPEAAISLTTA